MKQPTDFYTKDIFVDQDKSTKKLLHTPSRKCSICGSSTQRCTSICSIGQLGRKEKHDNL